MKVKPSAQGTSADATEQWLRDNDPFAKDDLDALADEESRKRGYDNWIEAYHHHERPREHAFSGSF
jgi:hypothetical protein